jgi:hypothetical protein
MSRRLYVTDYDGEHPRCLLSTDDRPKTLLKRLQTFQDDSSLTKHPSKFVSMDNKILEIPQEIPCHSIPGMHMQQYFLLVQVSFVL